LPLPKWQLKLDKLANNDNNQNYLLQEKPTVVDWFIGCEFKKCEGHWFKSYPDLNV